MRKQIRMVRINIRIIVFLVVIGLLFQNGFLFFNENQMVSKAANVGNVDVSLEGTISYSKAVKVLELVNQERALNGLNPLVMDNNLLVAAMGRAAECSLCFSHTRPDGLSCFTASSKMNGENIACGQSTPQEVMDEWLASPNHRGNILGSGYRSIGIGCFTVDGVTYWAQCFSDMDPKVATPLQDGDMAVGTEVSQKSLSIELATYDGENGYKKGMQYETKILGKTPESFQQAVISSDSATFHSSNTDVATIEKGIISCISAGVVTINATIGEVTTSLRLVVTGDAKEKGIGIQTVGSFVEITSDKQNLRYRITNEDQKMVTVLGLLQPKKTVVIPKTVTAGGQTYQVTAISKKAFYKSGMIRRITIGKNVSVIAKKAFYGCKNLHKITIQSQGIVDIGTQAFSHLSHKVVLYIPKQKKKEYKKLLTHAVQKKYTKIKTK